jgi:hypothetical protein
VDTGCGRMKNKIQKEISEWYIQHNQEFNVEELVDLVISKISDSMFDTVQKELEEEFAKGNLEQPFFISNEYYLELKMKDIKNKLSLPSEDD